LEIDVKLSLPNFFISLICVKVCLKWMRFQYNLGRLRETFIQISYWVKLFSPNTFFSIRLIMTIFQF